MFCRHRSRKHDLAKAVPGTAEIQPVCIVIQVDQIIRRMVGGERVFLVHEPGQFLGFGSEKCKLIQESGLAREDAILILLRERSDEFGELNL